MTAHETGRLFIPDDYRPYKADVPYFVRTFRQPWRTKLDHLPAPVIVWNTQAAQRNEIISTEDERQANSSGIDFSKLPFDIQYLIYPHIMCSLKRPNPRKCCGRCLRRGYQIDSFRSDDCYCGGFGWYQSTCNCPNPADDALTFLRTAEWIRREAFPLFLQSNHFEITGTVPQLYSTLCDLSGDILKHIKKLSIRLTETTEPQKLLPIYNMLRELNPSVHIHFDTTLLTTFPAYWSSTTLHWKPNDMLPNQQTKPRPELHDVSTTPDPGSISGHQSLGYQSVRGENFWVVEGCGVCEWCNPPLCVPLAPFRAVVEPIPKTHASPKMTASHKQARNSTTDVTMEDVHLDQQVKEVERRLMALMLNNKISSGLLRIEKRRPEDGAETGSEWCLKRHKGT